MRVVMNLLTVILCGVLIHNPIAAYSDNSKVIHSIKVPNENHAYTGAYIDFGDREDSVTFEAIEKFDNLVGKKQAIIGFSSDWGNQMFPEKQLKIISAYGAVPLVYWSPWDRPIGSPTMRNRFNLNKILAGEWDNYIDMWSTKAKDLKFPIMISWGLEMNGNWFPWSGYFYGGGNILSSLNNGGLFQSDDIRDSNSIHQFAYEGPETYKKTYKYVYDRVKKNGANNLIWIFHANNTSDPAQNWNTIANYYPGKEYVDWLGMSAYGKQYPDQGWAPFNIVIPKPYLELTKLDNEKPILLAEWGIGEFPESGNKAAWLEEAFNSFKKEFPRIKGAVYWHERWQNGDLSYSNLHVNSSQESLQVFRKVYLDSYWIDRPIIKK